MYFAHFVLIMLFQWSLAVSRLAVYTDGLNLYLNLAHHYGVGSQWQEYLAYFFALP